MSRDSLYLLIYDIAKDQSRTKAAKIVEGYGTRVQKSAFECRLTRGMKARLLKSLEAVELSGEDSIALYRLAKTPAHVLGYQADNPQSEDRHAIVL